MKSDGTNLPVSATQLQALSDADFLELVLDRDIELRLKDGSIRINAPVGAVTEDLKSELIRRKESLVHTCLAAPEIHGSLVLRAGPLGANQAPLTYAQERLWLLERFHPGNFAYNIPEVFELRDALDLTLLRQAIDTVSRRHGALRTAIIIDPDGEVLQQLEPSVTIPLEFTDLSQLNQAERDEQLKILLRAESRRPFDLAQAPLARFHYYHLGEERRLLLVNLHHIIADRWSMRILYRELTAAYAALAKGIPPNLPLLRIQYADYAVWERRGMRSRMQKQIQYWQKQLADLSEPMALPFTQPTSAAQPIEGAVCVVKMTPEDTTALRRLANAQGATLYMVLLAAYSALLRRYTGATDICIGSPVSERNYAETEPLIGLFVNTLVMRCKVPAQAGFLEVLRGVRDTVLDAHEHRDVPFQQVLRNLHLDQGSIAGGGSPLFQTMLAFDPLPVEAGASGTTEVELDPGFAKFDLTLQLREEPTCIAGWFEYRTDIVDAAGMRRFSASLLRLVRGILEDPARPIETIDILAPEERSLLLSRWNATTLPFPETATIHQLFERQAALTPELVAVIDGNERMTYRELDDQANRIARALQCEGVSVEGIVGVHLARSSRMIAALLGVLKAGAAYLPLDRQYPEARLRLMLEDSGCALAITDSGASWPFPAVKALDIPMTDVKHTDLESPTPTSAGPRNLAYVIYTSGSTGKPKGVAIEHHSTVSFLTWAAHTFPAEALTGTLASTPISFDLSVFEIFVPLTSGHTVVLAGDITQLFDLPAREEVTLATTVPSAAAALLDTGGIPSTLKTLNLAGEPLSAQLVDRLYAETSLTTVNDLYGPTETTTYSTWTVRARGTQASIGRPVANTRLYLLDEGLQPVPLGMSGELFIAGEGVARGYLHRPELTAERFVPVAHLGEQGNAYRTGDLCRYNSDGSLVYLGRIDQQIKLNGFRIELGEVEAMLRAHPSIEDAAVVARTEKSGAALVAAVRLAPGRKLDVAELIEYQVAAAPAHMIARRIIAVDHFPRTSSGKLDRLRLTAQIAGTPTARRTPAAPSDDTEKTLLSIWREGFLDDGIGIDDDFFQIGGHSLLALRIFAEIESRLGHRMMLSLLFDAPTVRLLAVRIRQDKPEGRV